MWIFLRLSKPSFYHVLSVIAVSCLMTPFITNAGQNDDVLEISVSSKAVIDIQDNRVIREQLPSTLFGFNMNHFHFQEDFWDESSKKVNDKIINDLRFFKGALYRYPGGLVANNFSWEDSVGPSVRRQPQKIVKWKGPLPVLFGVKEYLDFVSSVGGYPWYVLNLVGWDKKRMNAELSADEMARSNAQLASFMKEHAVTREFPRYYQLGNELDRAKYEWPHEKYIERAEKTIKAIQAVDPDAKFVAFMRDFDWKYRGSNNGQVSRYQDFMRDVLTGLPMVNDISFHYYYDEKGRDKKFRYISWRLRQFKQAIDYAANLRKGITPGLWITEHARSVEIGTGRAMQFKEFTSNLSASLSTSDFMIAIAQFPEIKGAALHGLNAGPWQIFDAYTQYNDLRPRPVYWGLRVLKQVDLPVVLATHTSSPNYSQYGGGYDVRAVSFTNQNRDSLGLWVVNRAPRAMDVEVRYKPFSGKEVSVQHNYIAGKEGRDPDDPSVEIDIQLKPIAVKKKVNTEGIMIISLPPASVSGILIR